MPGHSTLATNPALPYPTKEQVSELLDKYSQTHRSLGHVCAEMGIEKGASWAIIHNNPDLEIKFTRAQKRKAKPIVDSMSDDAENETLHPAHTANRLKAKTWISSRFDRETYGDHQTIDVKQTTIQVYTPEIPVNNDISSVDNINKSDLSK